MRNANVLSWMMIAALLTSCSLAQDFGRFRQSDASSGDIDGSMSDGGEDSSTDASDGGDDMNVVETRYALTVSAAGDGTGEVTSDPLGISCGATCSAEFTSGQTVQLFATPASGSVFLGWAGACSGTTTCAVTMTSARTVTAMFGRDSFTVVVNRGGTGAGTVAVEDAVGNPLVCEGEGTTCSVEVNGTNLLRLIATPSGTSTFLGWAGDCGGTLDTCNLFVDRDRNVGAVFADPASTETTLIVSRAGTGAGEIRSTTNESIECGATCFSTYDPSAMVTLEAVAEEGSTFGGWSGACASAGTSPTCEVLMNTSQSVGATFSANRYTVAVNRLGNGTVVSSPVGIVCSAESTQCATTLRHGTLVRLTASPDDGASFVSWQGGPCSGSIATTCEFTLTANVDVSANFSAMSFPLTVSTTGPGRVTTSPTGISCGDDCEEMFDFGMSVSLTATADSGAMFTGWTGDCSGETTSTCVVEMTSAHSVQAIFRSNINIVSVSITGDGEGVVTSDPAGISCNEGSEINSDECDEEFFYGQVVTLTANATDGSTFAGWSGACTGSNPTCTLSVTDALEAVATFVIGNNFVSVEKTGDGAARGNVIGRSIDAAEGTAPTIDCGSSCVGTFDVDSQVVLTASVLPGGSFAGWDPDGVCAAAGNEPTCIVDITGEPIVVRARFDLQSFTVSVSKDGTGGGIVSSTPAGVDCGADCTESIVYGSSITLVASADGSSEFVSWAGCTSSMGVSCTIASIDSAKAVTATFAKRRYTLTTTRTGTGVITSEPNGISCGSTCSADFDADTAITLTAAPTDASSQFASWSGCPSPTGNTCVVSLSAATTVSATFTTVPRTLSIAKTGNGSGTVTGMVGSAGDTPISCGATCNADISHGSIVTLTAMPAANNTFVGWSGSGCVGTGTCVVTMDAAKNVTAEFALMTYTLTASREGAGAGTISATAAPSGSGSFSCGAMGACSGSYNHGAMVTLTAAPDSASTFTGWSGEGCTGMGTCAVSMTAAKNVTATFAKRSYTLTVTISGNGTVNVQRGSSSVLLCTTSGSICTVSVEHGTSLSFQATPSGISSFSSWSGAITGSTNPATLVVTSAATVGASFSLTSDNVIVSKTGSGTGTVVASSGSINCGSTCSGAYLGTVTLTATPTSGSSTFVGWGGSCAAAGSSPTCMVTPGLGVANVTAQFELIQRTLTVDLGGSGTASIGASVITGGAGTFTCSSAAVPRQCTGTFPHGTTLKVTADPGAGTTFSGWTGAGCMGDAPCSLSMTADRSTTATFSLNSYTLSVTRDGSNPSGGTVTSSPTGINCNAGSADCSEVYAHGTNVTLTASNTAGTVFAGWSGACTGTSTTCNVPMTSAKNVIATFNTRMVTVTVTLSGSGQSFGRVTDSAGLLDCTSTTDPCTYSVPYGTMVLFTAASSNEGKALFAEWSGGACSGPFYLCGRTLNNDITLNARFENLRTLTLSFSGTGVGGTTEAFYARVGESTGGFGAGLGSCEIDGTSTPQTCELAVPVNTTFTLSPVMPPWAYVSAYSSPCSSPLGNTGRCEGSMSAASTVNVTISRRANIFFTTSTTYNGNLGGITGANAKCQTRANMEDLPGTYVAWISSTATDATTTIGSSAQGWITTSGVPIARTVTGSGQNALLDGGPRRYPNISESGSEIASPFEVWTHTASDGTQASGSPCTNWTAGVVGTAATGFANGARFTWTASGYTSSCSQTHHLYCMTTDITTAPVLPAPDVDDSSYYGFLSSTTMNGGGGIANADNACQTQADAQGFEGTYRAYLNTSSFSVKARFNNPFKIEYFRPDGISLGAASEMFDDAYSTANFPQAPINILANGTQYIPPSGNSIPVWGGGTSPTSTSTNNCSSWMSTAALSPTVGTPTLGAYWANGVGVTNCAPSYRFYCFRVAPTP